MRIVFMGSSEASALTLRAILRSPLLKVVGVVTQPDRPAGRSMRSTPCPCKAYAVKRGLSTILTPERVNQPEIVDQIKALRPDVIVVVAFGQFLGGKLLDLPRHGCLNGHFSILPLYRGAAPVQASIAAGDEVAGVTIMQMDKGMDDGDMLLKAVEPIFSDDTYATLMDRLAILNGVTMLKALIRLRDGNLPREAQNHDEATYAPKLKKSDGLIAWERPGEEIERLIRAYDPWPGTFTFLSEPLRKGAGCRLKVLQAEFYNDELECCTSDLAPGTVCMLAPAGPVVTTGTRPLCLTALQLEGGKRMDGRSFLNGYPLLPGEVFCVEP